MKKQEVPYSSLETPAVLVDMDKLEANIREMAQVAAEAGIAMRPHMKVHECADIAKMQIEGGACGIEVASVAQAEVMAEAGINDIMIAHPFVGEHKLKILQRLLSKPKLKLSVVVEMIEQAEGVSQVGQAAGRRIPVILKIETGANRFGVLPGKPALNLAKKLRQLPGIELIGIYAHEYKPGVEPTAEGADRDAFEVASIMTETAKMLRREGIPIEHVSVGASPTFRATCRYIKEGRFAEITEVHPGGYVIGDIGYNEAFANTRETCALTVLTIVVGTSHPDHAVIDAGFKALGPRPIIQQREAPDFFWKGKSSFGSIKGRPDLWLGRVSADCSCIYYVDPYTGPEEKEKQLSLVDPKKKLGLGERLEILVNNATIVIKLHDQIYGVRNGVVERVIPVTGRSRGN